MTHMPDATRMKRELAEIIAIRSENPPGGEGEVAVYVERLLKEEGFSVSLTEYKPGRFNVEAKLENGTGPVFAFNTHMDTVPAGDGWTSDAFTLREADGKLFGRGACDCKGPLIAMIEAMRMLAADRSTWSGTLLGVFVGDEEIASEGAKYYASTKPNIDFAVVGEPTSNTTYSAHKGSLRPVVRVQGVPAHSGTPHLGDNAIYRAGQLLTLIETYHNDVVRKRTHPLVGEASLTVTRISGGHADNVLPGACDLLLDRRMVPGEDEEVVKQELAALLKDAYDRFGVKAEIIDYKATTGSATETAPDHPVVLASLEACKENGTVDPGPFGFQGGCDLVHFRSLGAQGTVIGPGSLSVAHKADEFVPVDEFITCSIIYRDVARTMLRPAQ
ncbi:acetylornithine deacetylase/succinyl-diaminopimelate desuccinylase family protein [Agrobacterium larrymoorei]|uniref:Acetylornithine deacetylase/succinyl-diaminopimelate desuccinylase family protein n=1 Tax=Agrobacterium larrymoorei TaxID=160699 RepID=A0AAJ2BBJ4_9HYPH|nr:M20 family metallopeptidase [Agrobacterium larrymoorei]MDR6101597.1 acetylornithine deacetylase/succinyl-diaminopimelate desuccinylase family protein [Agrobacterium larrymoorei]